MLDGILVPGVWTRADTDPAARRAGVRAQGGRVLDCGDDVHAVIVDPPINKRKGQLMMFTAREMTSASRMKPPSAWYAMIIFARTVSGIVSVGLNATMFVIAT